MGAFRKKAVAGFTLIELMIVVAIIGILAAIAIPDFIKFQARSKQGEARANLKSWFTAEKSYYQNNSAYCVDTVVVGYQPERGNRYAYDFGVGAAFNGGIVTYQARNVATLDTTTSNSGIQADVYKYPDLTAAQAAGAAGAITWTAQDANHTAVGNTNKSGFTSAGATANGCTNAMGDFSSWAFSNIDNETKGVDAWAISTQSGAATTTAAQCSAVSLNPQVAGGTPFNAYNDVECDN